ncbi:MAG: FCD domain-containing protein [Casimicrobiaceae bacterium]
MTTVRLKARRYEPIVRHLEEAMLSGELAPGDRLPSERELMVTFGVGRGSVREALFVLQRMGLVALAAGERARVTRPTARSLVRGLSGAARQLLAAPDGVRHFQEARMLLECALARDAASRATPERLRPLFAAMEDHRLSRQRDRAIAADMLFHFRIAEMSDNPVLIALHSALGEWLREQRATSVQVRGAKGAAAAAHRRVYDAILGRDPDGAAAAMRGHLREVEDYYWKAASHLEAST